jgi:serine/threonine-protein kinase HipA
METNVLMVKLWGMPAGYLSWDKKSNTAVFEYEPEFLRKGLDIAPLTMPVNSPRSRKNLPWTGNKDKL